MIHINYGFGKGKTCSAVGLTIRMVGHGRKALFCQFLKNGTSGETKILKKNDVVYYCPTSFLDETANLELFDIAKTFADACFYDIIVLDEILDVIAGSSLTFDDLEEFINICQINDIELVITGHFEPPTQIIKLANYITYFDKQHHPYDDGIMAREGVEY